MTRFATVIGIAVFTAGAAEVAAQSTPRPEYLLRQPVASVTIHGGFAQPGGNSELWAFSFRELTFERGDLGGLSGGLDVAVALGSRWDVVAGLGRMWSRHGSEFREWVDQDDQPIEQTTRLQRSTIGAGLRYQLRSRGRSIGSYAFIPSAFRPWIGAGLGQMHYRFEQAGDFVDFETLAVFPETFRSEGWTTFAQASVGAGWAVSPRYDLSAELRYVGARGELGAEFEGFDKLDLSGVNAHVGLTVRF